MSTKQKRYITFFLLFTAIFIVVYFLSKDSSGLLVQRATRLFNEKNYSAAAELTEPQVLKIKGPVIDDKSNLSSLLFLHGKIMRKLKRYNDASLAFEKLLTTRAFDPDYHDEYALTLFSLNKLNQARGHLITAISIKKKPEYYNHLGMICIKNPNWHYEATSYLDSAIKINPKYVPAHINHGWLCYLKGQYDSAIWWFKESLKIDPYNQLACRNMGLTYKALGNTTLSMQWQMKSRTIKNDR